MRPSVPRFGATIIQVVSFEALVEDFLFAKSIGLDNAWVIDQFGIDGSRAPARRSTWSTAAP